jgi:hypothetical protein
MSPAKPAKGTLLKRHPFLHRDTALERQALGSFAGQAHFATGPHCCGECRCWMGREVNSVAVCARFTQLMGGRRGPKVPRHAASCHYFEPKPG